jgi:hypothetical protein
MWLLQLPLEKALEAVSGAVVRELCPRASLVLLIQPRMQASPCLHTTWPTGHIKSIPYPISYFI